MNKTFPLLVNYTVKDVTVKVYIRSNIKLRRFIFNLLYTGLLSYCRILIDGLFDKRIVRISSGTRLNLISSTEAELLWKVSGVLTSCTERVLL